MLAAGRGGGAQGRGACAAGVEVLQRAADACGERWFGAAPAVNAPQVAVPRTGVRRTAAIDARLRRLAGVRVRHESQRGSGRSSPVSGGFDTNLNVGRVATWVGSLISTWVGSLESQRGSGRSSPVSGGFDTNLNVGRVAVSGGFDTNLNVGRVARFMRHVCSERPSTPCARPHAPASSPAACAAAQQARASCSSRIFCRAVLMRNTMRENATSVFTVSLMGHSRGFGWGRRKAQGGSGRSPRPDVRRKLVEVIPNDIAALAFWTSHCDLVDAFPLAAVRARHCENFTRTDPVRVKALVSGTGESQRSAQPHMRYW